MPEPGVFRRKAFCFSGRRSTSPGGLERQGVKIVSCRTCVDYFDIEKDISVGVIDGMVPILEILATRNVMTV